MKKILWFVVILGLVLAGCAGVGEIAVEETAEEIPNPQVTPYYTDVPDQTLAPTLTPTPTLTPPPLPTPTPFVHTVSEGETMIGIANFYGVSLDALGVANPEVNPNFLSVGAQLIIPLELDGEEEVFSPAEPDVVSVTGGEVTCIPNRGGGMWCFWPVANSLTQPVENLAGLIHFYGQDGEVLLSQPAYSLLNLLEPGETIPLGTYLKPPLPDWHAAQGQITSASTANQAEDRYLAHTVEGLIIQAVDDAGLVTRVSGTVSIEGLEEQEIPAYVWVLATAYDDADQVVGLRRWETPAEQLGESVSFEFDVYSVGRPIARVEILSEARASGE